MELFPQSGQLIVGQGSSPPKPGYFCLANKMILGACEI